MLSVSGKPKNWVYRWGRRGPSPSSFRGGLGTQQQQWGKPKREECFLGAEMFCHVWPWPLLRYLVNLPGVTSLVPLSLVVLFDTVTHIPLAAACRLPETLIIGLMVQKLTMEGTKAAKATVICFPFWNSPKQELRKGWGVGWWRGESLDPFL